MDRPHEPGSVRSGGGPDRDPSRVADRDVPAGIRAAVDRTAARKHALTINRLAQREVDAMIDRVAGNKPLPASIRQDIIERTDGIPLFVEEMTKAVLEAEERGRCRARGCGQFRPRLWRFPRACTPR